MHITAKIVEIENEIKLITNLTLIDFKNFNITSAPIILSYKG